MDLMSHKENAGPDFETADHKCCQSEFTEIPIKEGQIKHFESDRSIITTF